MSSVTNFPRYQEVRLDGNQFKPLSSGANIPHNGTVKRERCRFPANAEKSENASLDPNFISPASDPFMSLALLPFTTLHLQ